MSYRLQDLAERFDCQLEGDSNTYIDSVCTLQNGKPNAISFLANSRYRRYLSTTNAAAVILKPEETAQCPVAVLRHANPYLCYARIAALLSDSDKRIKSDIHKSATIHPTAKLGKNIAIGPDCFIDEGVSIGDNCRIGPGVVLFAGVQIGEYGTLYANITVYQNCIIGKRVILHAGVVIGADGFGIALNGDEWIKIPQLGRVVIGDNVEIGACTSVDRGAIDDTVIEDGVKLDNQIQIGHNVHIGAHTAIAGCTGIAGSSTIGKRCHIGGMVAVIGHLELADDVRINARSIVTKSITEAGTYSSGTPLQSNKKWLRNRARFGQLDDMAKRLNKIEKMFSQE